MARELSVVLVGEDRHLANVLDEIRKIRFIPIHLEIARLANLKEMLTRIHPQLVIYGADGDADTILKTAAQIANEFSKLYWAVVAKETDVDTVLNFFRLGASDFLREPIQSEDLKRLIQNVFDKEKVQETNTKGEEHRAFALFSTKGGVGLTTIAANLGVELAKSGAGNTLLIDLVSQHGNIADVLDLPLQYTLADAIENFERMDLNLLMNSLVKHKSGCHVLPATKKIDDADLIATNHTSEIFQLLKSMFRYVIADVGHEFSRTTISFLDIADVILLVATPDVLSLSNTRDALDTFQQLGYNTDKVKLILNRWRMKGEIDLNVIKKNCSVDIFFQLPDDPLTCLSAVNQGKPLCEIDKNSNATKSIQKLALSLAEVQKRGTLHVASRTP